MEVTRLDQVNAVRSLRDAAPSVPQRQLARSIVNRNGSVNYNVARRVLLSLQSIYAIIRRHDLNRKAKEVAAA